MWEGQESKISKDKRKQEKTGIFFASNRMPLGRKGGGRVEEQAKLKCKTLKGIAVRLVERLQLFEWEKDRYHLGRS